MDLPRTHPFDAFWAWMLQHPNCILRAGTPETILYDDDDLHWFFTDEGGPTLIVQLLRGKRLVGELLVEPELVTYVEENTGDREGEYVFELISENEIERVACYFFVLIHGSDDLTGADVSGPVH